MLYNMHLGMYSEILGRSFDQALTPCAPLGPWRDWNFCWSWMICRISGHSNDVEEEVWTDLVLLLHCFGLCFFQLSFHAFSTRQCRIQRDYDLHLRLDELQTLLDVGLGFCRVLRDERRSHELVHRVVGFEEGKFLISDRGLIYMQQDESPSTPARSRIAGNPIVVLLRRWFPFLRSAIAHRRLWLDAPVSIF